MGHFSKRQLRKSLREFYPDPEVREQLHYVFDVHRHMLKPRCIKRFIIKGHIQCTSLLESNAITKTHMIGQHFSSMSVRLSQIKTGNFTSKF